MSLSGYQRSTWDCEERNEFPALTFRFSYHRFLSICCIPHAVPLDISLQHLWKSTIIIASGTTVIWIIIIISAWNCCWLVYFLSPPSEYPLSSSLIYFPWIGEFLKTVRWNGKKKERFHCLSPKNGSIYNILSCAKLYLDCLHVYWITYIIYIFQNRNDDSIRIIFKTNKQKYIFILHYTNTCDFHIFMQSTTIIKLFKIFPLNS